jgi:hypothetical protein
MLCSIGYLSQRLRSHEHTLSTPDDQGQSFAWPPLENDRLPATRLTVTRKKGSRVVEKIQKNREKNRERRRGLSWMGGSKRW